MCLYNHMTKAVTVYSTHKQVSYETHKYTYTLHIMHIHYTYMYISKNIHNINVHIYIHSMYYIHI